MDRGPVGCSPWGSKELDTTEQLSTHTGVQNGLPVGAGCLGGRGEDL